MAPRNKVPYVKTDKSYKTSEVDRLKRNQKRASRSKQARADRALVKADILEREREWVDTCLSNLTYEEKVRFVTGLMQGFNRGIKKKNPKRCDNLGDRSDGKVDQYSNAGPSVIPTNLLYGPSPATIFEEASRMVDAGFAGILQNENGAGVAEKSEDSYCAEVELFGSPLKECAANGSAFQMVTDDKFEQV